MRSINPGTIRVGQEPGRSARKSVGVSSLFEGGGPRGNHKVPPLSGAVRCPPGALVGRKNQKDPRETGVFGGLVGDRLPVGDEHHEDPKRGAQDNRCDLAVL